MKVIRKLGLSPSLSCTHAGKKVFILSDLQINKGVFLVFFLLLLVSPTVIDADEEITYRLFEDKPMHQFIISGEENDFEVNMVLPDGTTVDHEDFDPDAFMYFSLENQRIWALTDAKEGTYTFEVITSSDEDFSVRDSDSVERPNVEWNAPLDETIQLQTGDILELEWEISGEFSSGFSNMNILLSPAEGGHTFEVATASVGNESYELELPDSIPSGDYELFIELDDEYVSETLITPEVTITYENPDYNLETVELVEQRVENGVLYVVLDIPRTARFNELNALITGEETELESTIDINELVVMEELEDSNHYLWDVTPFTENGEYEGQIRAIQRDNAFSEAIELDAFQVFLNDLSDDGIEWSLDQGLTNASSVSITTSSEPGILITVEDEGRVLLQEEIGEEEQEFSVPLQEGHRVIEVTLSDEHNNSFGYSRSFQVDHTPPILEMIQPLPAHTQLDEAFASGYVEAGSTLVVNGQEIDYDENGYFRADNIGNSLTIVAADESGNETIYTWEPAPEQSNAGWIWPVLIGVGISGSTGGFIFYLRKTKP
jgi:hypothetical protein